jgi:hypothetical protein
MLELEAELPAADWDWRAHYAAVQERTRPATRARAVFIRPPAIRVLYDEPIGPIKPLPKSKWPLNRKAINARPDLARFIYAKRVIITRPKKGRILYFYPIGPKAPEIAPTDDKMPVKQIIAEEMARTGMTWEEYICQKRRERFNIARRRLYWRLYRQTGLSLPRIGALMKRDHSTILHGVRRHEETAQGVAR